MEHENIVSGLVRVGTVTDVNADECRARVKFWGEGMTSGWLYVLQRSGGGVSVPDAGGHGHTADVSANGSHRHVADLPSDGSHSHTVTIAEQPDHTHEGSQTSAWMPKINDKVLVLYLPTFNADGFILGVIA